MCFGIEECLLISLPVNVDEKRPQIAQQRVGRELIVDEDLVATGRGDLATNDQFVKWLPDRRFQADLQAQDLA